MKEDSLSSFAGSALNKCRIVKTDRLGELSHCFTYPYLFYVMTVKQ
ncbi:hypothetical protein LS684_15770 [Cytobacillus spongiae]|nr:hypothetical protein LS684_15770 [Cytobacillus spongiae]